jgi:YVTN family beta-propeller protein
MLLRTTFEKRLKKYVCIVIVAAILSPVFYIAVTSSQSNASAPFAEDTIFLSNSSLINGNPTSTVKAVSESELLDEGGNSLQVVGEIANPSISVGAVPNGIAFDPINGNLYVADFSPGTVSVINGSTNSISATLNLNLPASPWDVAFNPYNANIYVSDTRSGAVSVISTNNNSVLTNVAVGDDMLSGDHDDRPNGVVFNPYNNEMYVAMYGSGFLAEINSDTNILTGNAPVGYYPYVNRGLWGLAFDVSNCNFYTTNELENTVTVINAATNLFVASVNVGRSPNGVAIETLPGPNYGNIFVTNYAANTVSVINSSSNLVLNTISVGQNPDGIALASNTGELFVTNFGDGTVSVINGITDSVVDTIQAGSGASGIAYDPWNGNMYVTNSNIGTVSIISTGQDSSSSASPTSTSTIQSANPACIAAVDSSNASDVSITTTLVSSETISGFSQNTSFTSSLPSESTSIQSISSYSTNSNSMTTNTRIISSLTSVSGDLGEGLFPFVVAAAIGVGIVVAIFVLKSRFRKIN